MKLLRDENIKSIIKIIKSRTSLVRFAKSA
ncbi:Uncharacterised protein [Mycoplasmopsis columbinasalis]|uniref:Uncharacterized protein n=1 Tax=Mycoplasmopsis columbinasalis TaxID=114880 RepID=A0A449BB26_9BACT|nr:Uncharacterised protein [Mycoplasmopsis columbinasalis]